MPECHSCQHNGKNSLACLRCPGPPQTNHKGRSHISIDSGASGGTLGEVEAVLHAARQSPPPKEDIQADRAAVCRFVAKFFEMDEKSLRIVRYRFMHPDVPLSKIAKRHRVSTQSVHQRLKKLAEDWPAVKHLVGLKLKR